MEPKTIAVTGNEAGVGRPVVEIVGKEVGDVVGEVCRSEIEGDSEVVTECFGEIGRGNWCWKSGQ
jgi:hypothetical protein